MAATATLRKVRSLLSGLAAVGVVVVLAGCIRIPFAAPESVDAPTAAPIASPSAAPVVSNPEITVLTPDQVTSVPQFTRSEPAGSFPIGAGLPDGFPAGVPAYSDRWIDRNVTEFESNGRYGLGVLFWGDYAAVDALLVAFRDLGYDVVDQTLETRRVSIAENDDYRVTITASESAVLPGTDELIDPSYHYTIVYLS